MNWKHYVIGGVIGFGTLVGAISLISSGKKEPSLEQRTKYSKEYNIKFGTLGSAPSEPDKYVNAKETYGDFLGVTEAVEDDYEKKRELTAMEEILLASQMDTDGSKHVSPEEITAWKNGKKADGTERTYAKKAERLAATGTALRYTVDFDFSPDQMNRLNDLVDRYSAARGIKKEEKWYEVWTDVVYEWVANKFGNGYMNKEAVDKFDAYIKEHWEASK